MQRSRRTWICACQLALAALAACQDEAGKRLDREREAVTLSTPSRRNVVVIMVDDLDVGSLKEMLDLKLMPNLQQEIVAPGFEFRESFVSYSLCCPSRSTFLTGQYPHNHSVMGNELPIGGVTKLDDTSTVATWLEGQGYYTGHVGKYLNGYGYDVKHETPDPRDDEEYVPPGYTEWHGLVGPSTYKMFGYCINHGTVGTKPQCYGNAKTGAGYQTDVLATIADGFLGRAADRGKPFFLVVTPVAPHTEGGIQLPGCPDTRFGAYIRPDPKDEMAKPQAWRTIFGGCPGAATGSSKQIVCTPPLELATKSKPSFNEPDMSDKPLWMQKMLKDEMTATEIDCLARQHRSRLGALLAVDDLVGKIVETLRTRGVLDNTVLFFTSDNGYLQGEHRWDTKLLAYEESIRVPLYIRPPTPVAPRVIERMALNNDLAQTVADYAGVPPPEGKVDGRSLKPLMDGTLPPSAPWRRRFHVEYAQLGPGLTTYPTDFEYELAPPKKFLPTAVYTFSGVRLGAEEQALPNMTYGQLWLDGKKVPSSSECYDLVSDEYQLASWAKGRCTQQGAAVYLENLASTLGSCKAAQCRLIEEASE
jgi:arylsulfatase A-like enzyme